jgi:hypothetical protein
VSAVNSQNKKLLGWFSGEQMHWFIIALILCLATSQGILQAMDVPVSPSKAAIDLLSFGLLVLAIWSRRKAGQAVVGLSYLVPIALAVFAGLLSGWFYGALGLEYALFLRTLISPVVIFFAIININLPDAAIRRVVILLCFLFFSLYRSPLCSGKCLWLV